MGYIICDFRIGRIDEFYNNMGHKKGELSLTQLRTRALHEQ